MKYDTNNNEEEEGEQFDFDSGDEAPEADRGAPGTPEAGHAGTDAASTGSGESQGAPHRPTLSVLPGGTRREGVVRSEGCAVPAIRWELKRLHINVAEFLFFFFLYIY